LSFTIKLCVCASTWIPGRDLLLISREYSMISLCFCVLLLSNACALLLLKWSGRVFSVMCQDSACLHTNTHTHTHTHTHIYIYIYYTHQLCWNILDWRTILSKYNMLLVKGQYSMGMYTILEFCKLLQTMHNAGNLLIYIFS
jgi:hypothetical protein